MKKTELIQQLQTIGAIKFGDFTLKSGRTSSVYIDLRVIVSYPRLLKTIAQALWEKAAMLNFEHICGVPYTALPLATCMSVDNQKPMLMRRKEAKQHGTKQKIEGHFQPEQRCLIVEDVITTGSSVLETINDIHYAGLVTVGVISIVDREEGGKKRLEEAGYAVSSLLTLADILK